MLADALPLADELVHPRLGDGALAGLVDVEAAGITRRLTVEAHGEADRRTRGGRREDQVEIARLEAVRDRAGGRFEDGGLLADRPFAGERPLIEREPVGALVTPAALAAGVAHVGLGGPQGVPVGGLGDARSVDVAGLPVDAQQTLDRPLGLLVRPLAEVVEPDTPVAIDEVDSRPVVVLERPPDGEVVIDDDRVTDAEFACRAAHVLEVVLEPELGRMHADDDEPAVAVPLVPRADVRQRAKPVDARVGPEVDEDDAPAQSLGRERLGVEPDGRAVERRERTVDGVGRRHR